MLNKKNDKIFSGKHTANNTNPVDPISLDYKTKQKTSHKKMSFKKKATIISIVVAVVLAIAIAVVAYANYILNTTFEDEGDLKAREHLTETTFDKPFYMVLVGTDTREDGKSYSLEEGRSDTCLLVRIDPVNYVATMLSIPRDTQITLNGSTEKFNAAYSYGGITETIAQVKKLCNVDVSYYAEISFNGMIDLVNAIGGVDVEVEEEVNDINVQAYVPAGKRHLNGEEALSYARTRQFADGDFTRTEDQRNLLRAIVNQAMKMNVADIPNIMKAAKKFIKSNMTLGEMISLSTKFRDKEQVTMYAAMVPSTTGTVGDASYVFTNKEDLVRMMKMMDAGEDISMFQPTNGASIGSARTQADKQAQQEQYYKDHPNSPGKAPTTISNHDSLQ